MMASPTWRLRQFSAIDADGRVVDIRLEKSVGRDDVAGWRVRWDTPEGRPKSRNFAKSRHATPKKALKAARDLVATIENADREGWQEGESGVPVSPEAPAVAEVDVPANFVGLLDLGKEWMEVRDGSPKSRQGREGSINFAARIWGNRDVSGIGTQEALALLQTRRTTPGHKATRAIACEVLDSTDKLATMCSRRTEALFLNDMKSLFEYAVERTPAACDANPFAPLKTRSKDTEIPDPTKKVTFDSEEVMAIWRAIEDEALAGGALLRGVTAGRTGELALVTTADIDPVTRIITARGSEGEAPARLTSDGTTRQQRSLKNRPDGETREVPYPAHPLLDHVVQRLLVLAVERHALRTESLKRNVDRYTREKAKRHLVDRSKATLRKHLASSPRLVTMPDGSPFHVSNFSSRHWKPALAEVFHEDTQEHRVKRQLRFYALRSAAIEWMIEDCDLPESEVALFAGHTVETQQRYYRLSRGSAVRKEAVDALGRGATRAFEGAALEHRAAE